MAAQTIDFARVTALLDRLDPPHPVCIDVVCMHSGDGVAPQSERPPEWAVRTAA